MMSYPQAARKPKRIGWGVLPVWDKRKQNKSTAAGTKTLRTQVIRATPEAQKRSTTETKALDMADKQAKQTPEDLAFWVVVSKSFQPFFFFLLR